MADQMRFRVTPEQAESAGPKLAEAGFPISGDSGAVEKGGYSIAYALTERVLLLDVLAKPRFVPMMAVKAKIRSVLAGEGDPGISVMESSQPPSSTRSSVVFSES